MTATPAATAAHAPPWLLLFTAAFTGALVMVVEVLGSRVIGPFFGVSLFVWTALITVTLLALAMGYAVGGRLADRWPQPALLYALIMAAGVLVAAVPLVKVAVLKAALPLGLRAGTLAAATLLFGPALFLLGCVSPFVVRLAAREWGRLGRTVGLLYAVSTTGSFVGTLTTGFFLIAYVGVSQAFFWAGLALVALGALYFVFFRRWRVAALAPLLALALMPHATLPSVTMADGTEARVVHSEDSFYGTIRVVDYRFGARHHREMIIDGLVQGGLDMVSRRSIYEYAYLLQWLPSALHPGPRSCLVIGVGAGIVPAWYEAQGIATDVIDIDPQVIAVARRHFGYAPRGEVWIGDARALVMRLAKRYDIVVLDVFNGDTTPSHLLSIEALAELRERLADGGVLAINIVGRLADEADAMQSVVATLRALFTTVELYPVFERTREDDAGNIVITAYQGPRRERGGRPPGPLHPLAQAAVERAWAAPPFELPVPPGTATLRDDFNPLDLRDIAVKEGVRRRILETTHPDILVGG